MKKKTKKIKYNYPDKNVQMISHNVKRGTALESVSALFKRLFNSPHT